MNLVGPAFAESFAEASASGEATADGGRESEGECESDELDKEGFLERWNYGKVVEAFKSIALDE